MPRRCLPVVVALALAAAACASSPLQQARRADALQDYDLAIARYARAIREDPDNSEARQGLEVAKLRASDAHFERGRRLSSQGRYEDALLELQVATELNPANADADRDLQQVRVALREQLRAETGSQTELQALLARTYDLAPASHALPDAALEADIATGPQSTARAVYLLIARLAGLSVSGVRMATSNPRRAAASASIRPS